jgi:hypothetical protein
LFDFRKTNPGANVGPNFRGANYLSTKERVDRAVKEAEIFETEKWYTKVKFQFRPSQPIAYLNKAFT